MSHQGDKLSQEIAGDDSDTGSERQAPARARSGAVGQRAQKRPKRSARFGRRDEVGEEDEGEGEECESGHDSDASENACFLCKRALSHDCKIWRGEDFHMHCYNVVRCALRQCRSSDAKADLIDSVTDDPTLFRQTVGPLVSERGATRRSSARREFRKKTMTGLTTYKTKQRTQAKMYMTKRRYKGFVRMWEGVDSEAASADFDEALDIASSEHMDSDGEPRIVVKDNEREENINGEKTFTSRTEAEQPRHGELGSSPSPPKRRRDIDRNPLARLQDHGGRRDRRPTASARSTASATTSRSRAATPTPSKSARENSSSLPSSSSTVPSVVVH